MLHLCDSSWTYKHFDPLSTEVLLGWNVVNLKVKISSEIRCNVRQQASISETLF